MLTEHVYLKKHIASTQQDKPMIEQLSLNGFCVPSKTGNLNIVRDGRRYVLSFPSPFPQ